MAKMVKSLTKVNGGKVGIEVANELNFGDDGNFFRGFMYKGMPMTQCYSKKDGEVYLSIRVDYLKNNFTYKEWMETEEYHLCDEFNGVSEFDLEKLVENLERVIAKVAEMNANAEISEAELEEAKQIIGQEVSEIEDFTSKIKYEFEWWNCKNNYYIKSIIDCMQTLEKKAQQGRDLIDKLDTMSIIDQKTWIERSRNAIKNVNSKMLGGDFYMKQIEEYTKKSLA